MTADTFAARVEASQHTRSVVLDTTPDTGGSLMPRPGPRRPLTALRLSTDDQTWADQRASSEGIVKGDGRPNRSELIRLSLAYARCHMPQGWRPTPAEETAR